MGPEPGRRHEGDRCGRPDFHTFEAKILMDNEPKLIAVVVRYSNNINKYKAHKLYMPGVTVVDMDKKQRNRGGNHANR